MFQVRDIVASAPGWTKGVFVITGINPSRPKTPYTAVELTKGSSYGIGDNALLPTRIGVCDEAYFATLTGKAETGSAAGITSAPAASPSELEAGRRRAQIEIQAIESGLDKKMGGEADEPIDSALKMLKRWKTLAEAKPGDPLTIRRRGKNENVTFLRIIPGGEAYHFAAANKNGTPYKWPIDALVA